MELPPLNINEVSFPAVEEKVYNKGWLTQLTVASDDPKNTSVYAIIRPARDTDNGIEILVKDGTERVIKIDDLFGTIAGSNPKITPETLQKLGQAMYMVLDALNSYQTDLEKPDEVEPIKDETEPIPEN